MHFVRFSSYVIDYYHWQIRTHYFVLRRKIVCIKTPKWLKIWEKQQPRFKKGFNRVSAIFDKPSEVLINYSLFFRVIYIPISTPVIDIFDKSLI